MLEADVCKSCKHPGQRAGKMAEELKDCVLTSFLYALSTNCSNGQIEGK